MGMMRHRNAATATVVAAMLTLSALPATAADDPWFHRGGHGFFDTAGRFPHDGGPIFGFAVDGLPTRIPGLGTYVGAIGAVRDRGNGNYFAIQGGLEMIDAPVDRGAVKIIHVTPETAKATCREENGVCIIRP